MSTYIRNPSINGETHTLDSIGGFVGAIIDPSWFIAAQVPHDKHVLVSGHDVVVTEQLGNLYLLLALIGIAILTTTSEVSVVRSYLAALAIGDVGHVAISCYGLGWEHTMSPSQWSAVGWGNIPFTVSRLLHSKLIVIPCLLTHGI